MFNFDDPTPEGAEALVFAQKGALGPFVGLSFKNGLLNIITLSLYRFWGKTEVRRRLWRTIYLNDEPLEYTGRGVELFLGFLFAILVIGLPFLMLVVGIQFLGPAAALLIFPLYIFLFVLLGYGRFTAFRYLASRTRWRGVRFQLKGSPLKYGLTYLGYLLLSVVTLGWFWPAAKRRLAAPLWDGLRFGDRRLRFDLNAARNVSVYAPFIPAAFGFGVIYVVSMGLVFAAHPELARRAAGSAQDPMLVIQMYGVLLLLGVLYVIMFAPYHAAQLKAVAEGVRLDGARFRLKLGWADMAALYLTNIAMIIFSLGFLMPLVEARTARFLIRRLSSTGVADLESALQAPAGPRTGEGLADAFGVITV